MPAPDAEAPSTDTIDARVPRHRGATPWLVVAGALIAGAALLNLARSPGGPSAPRTTLMVEPIALTEEEVAGAVGGSGATRVSPPIDVDAAERWAARLPFGAVPVPAERDVRSWRTGTGAEVTQAVLYYPDPADAERLGSRAETLLGGGLGLEATPLEIPGVEAAMGWSGSDFRGASFRSGSYVVFVGISGPAPTDAPVELARAALGRIGRTTP